MTFSRAQIRQPTDDRTIACLTRRFSRFAVSNKVYLVPIDQVSQLGHRLLSPSRQPADHRSKLEEDSLFEGLDDLLHTFFDHDDAIAPFSPARSDAEGDDISDSLPAVLDCGFGAGGWIDRMLVAYPDGLDVSLHTLSGLSVDDRLQGL